MSEELYKKPSFWKTEKNRLYECKLEASIPFGCTDLLNRLIEAGYDSYVVGGCVRDILLGYTPKDYDITTQATPEQMKEVLNDLECYETGIKHGTLAFKCGNSYYEVTTFRVDGEYSDGRHPDNVEFARTINEDLSRRDFKINAFAYNPNNGLVFPEGADYDLEHKIISCVGDPNKRFKEDALRILRAIRFSVCYGFSIENKTKLAMYRNKYKLRGISAERVQQELRKMFDCLNGLYLANAIYDYYTILSIATGCYQIDSSFFYEQNNKHHDRSLFDHTIDTVACLSNEKLRFAALFHDFGKMDTCEIGVDGYNHYPKHALVSEDIARSTLKDKLKFDNSFVDEVCFYVRSHEDRPSPTKKSMRRFLNKCGDYDKAYNLLLLMKADISTHSKWSCDQHKDDILKCFNILGELAEEDACFKVSDLDISGLDLINIGFKQDKKLGGCLQYLLKLVMDEEVENNKAALMNKALLYLKE